MALFISAAVLMGLTRPPSICLRSSTEIVRPPLPLFMRDAFFAGAAAGAAVDAWAAADATP